MKRLLVAIFVLLILASALPVLGQNDNLVALNDTTPAINVNVTLPPDATGVVSLNLSMAAVTVTDAQGNVVFQATDSRVHALELSLAPNSGAYVIRVERLPGVTASAVSVQSLADLTNTGTVEFVQFDNVSFNQERTLPLSPTVPGDTVNLNIPVGIPGIVTATFRGGSVTSQFVDSAGAVVATSKGGGIDGLNLVLDGGAYSLTLLGNNLDHDITAGVRVMSADTAGISLLPVTSSTVAAIEVNSNTTVTTTTSVPCTATVASTSINLRSGPGTGYSVLENGYLNQSLVVGGTNPEQNWLLVGTQSGSAWVARNLTQLSGGCDSLTVFNIPLRDAQPASIIVQAAPNQTFSQGSSAGQSFSGEHENEHEEGDND